MTTVVILLALAVTVMAAMLFAAQPAPPTGTSTTTAKAVSIRNLDRKVAEMQKRYVINESRIFAMCYDIAMAPNIEQFVCPMCGSRSLAPDNASNDLVRTTPATLRTLRAELAAVTNTAPLKLALDEIALCLACTPTAAVRRVALVVTYPDGSTHRTPNITVADARLLKSFFKGGNSLSLLAGAASPSTNTFPRMRTLLGPNAATLGRKKEQ